MHERPFGYTGRSVSALCDREIWGIGRCRVHPDGHAHYPENVCSSHRGGDAARFGRRGLGCATRHPTSWHYRRLHQHLHGELVYIEGRYQELVQFKADGSWSAHLSSQSIVVGDQGNVYVFKEDAWGKIDTGGNATYYDMLRLVSQGPGPNLLASIRLNISPSGEVELVSLRDSCAV